jgi:acyl-coenzyme A thioesterase PaaI-like protein
MNGHEEAPASWRHTIVEGGEWDKWMMYASDPFEDVAGPFYYRIDPDGRLVCAFRAEAKHMNGGGFLHGGAIMTFADYSLFLIARDELRNTGCVTATFNGEFVGAVPLGALVECRGEVVKAGRSMIFVRGLITTGGEPVMSFSSVIKKTAHRT